MRRGHDRGSDGGSQRGELGDTVIGAEMWGPVLGTGVDSSDGDHNEAPHMNQLGPDPKQWAQVWGAVLEWERGPLQGPQQRAMMGQSWGARLGDQAADLTPCLTATYTQAGPRFPPASGCSDTQGFQDCLEE